MAADRPNTRTIKSAKRAVSTAKPPIEPGSHLQARASHVHEALRRQVFERRLIAGTRLNIDQIALDLGVSATPVREAINRMAMEGLAVYEQFSGFTLAPPLGRKDIGELQQLRRLLETFAARTSAANIPAETLESLRACTQGMQDLATEANYAAFKAFDSADNDFHEIIVRSAGNRFLVDSYAAISARVRMVRMYYAGGPTDMRSVVAEHWHVLAAFEERDGAMAAESLNKHLEAASRRLTAMVEHFTTTEAAGPDR